MTKNSKNPGNSLNRARPLAERLDEPTGLWTQRELGCKLNSRATNQRISWPTPIFSRLALDVPEYAKWIPTLQQLRRTCGVSIVEPEKRVGQDGSAYLSSGADRSLDDGLSIEPVFVDEPIGFESLMHAEQIELQFIPSRVQSSQGSIPKSYSADRWLPTLPSDLTDIEKMSKRIELLRSASDQATVILGATIPAGSVYDDVRFLIDCGFDYLNVLAEVVAGVLPAKTWTLQPIDYVIEQALGAISKSGVRGVGLLVCSPIENVQDAVRLMHSGADAFSIDSWLVKQQASSTQTSQPAEDLGSFMGSYARPSAPSAMEGLLTETQSFMRDFKSLRYLYEI
jgi:hypothetical protein